MLEDEYEFDMYIDEMKNDNNPSNYKHIENFPGGREILLAEETLRKRVNHAMLEMERST